jgi:regulator of protease activity HflC (stomatin/prohibitin superfamily)
MELQTKGQIMETVLGISLAAVPVVIILLFHLVVIYEYQRGLLYRNGRYVQTLTPGRHICWRLWESVVKVDVREAVVTIPGQEVLSADNVSVKTSLALRYKVDDPRLALNRVASFRDSLYLIAQLAARTIIGTLEVEELLAKRAEIGKRLLDDCRPAAKEMGIDLLAAELKDVMFPAELKNIFAQVVNARKEGQAALEKARGESAALRNLANAARLLEENPSLRHLRLFQVLEKNSGNTVVYISPEDVPFLKRKPGAETKDVD